MQRWAAHREDTVVIDLAGEPAPLAAGGIDELFRGQVQRRPDALAVVCGDRRLTFRALASRTGRLAARLRALGVGPERRVALVMDRSVELAVATLAIVEAGGAFVPLDPKAPAARIRAFAAAARADLTLTRRSLGQVAGEPSASIVMIDVDDAGEPAPPTSMAPPGNASRLFYVMHTSGSTAAPRAVEVEHAASIDQVQRLAADLGFGPDDRHVHTASLGFTLAVRQLVLPLCLGGAVVIGNDAELADPLALLRAASRAGATVLDLVPSLLRAIVAALRALPAAERAAAIPDRLRFVLTAGERLTADVVSGWWAVAGTSARMINLYGASELGGSVAWHEVVAADVGRASIPIGRARTGTVLAIFDPEVAALSPVDDAAIGELCVAGAAVARGYVRPEAAGRARFVDATGRAHGAVDADPGERIQAGAAALAGGSRGGRIDGDRNEHGRFGPGDDSVRHARWFRTGDLARRAPDGALELVGRLDEEVKIRGVRVQPEAVEAVLGSVPGVTEVAVVPSAAASGALLVAYVAGTVVPRDAELRERVRSALPAVFVPAAVVRVAELPRLASGKVDRRALRDRAARELATGAVPASTIERLVAHHWEAVLGVAPRGVADDFFALGGSSLAAFELSGRLGEALGEALDPALVFDRPTLGAQAAWLCERPEARRALPRLAPCARPAPDRCALSFAQERLWLGELLARAEHAPRVHRALRLTGRLDEARLDGAMCAVAARHAALRTTFAAEAGQPYQTVHASLPRDHETVDLTACTAETRAAEVARLQAAARADAFELERGPLWRTRLLRLGLDDHVLLVTIHHLVSDGWSMRRWLEEVSTYYAGSSGAAAGLPALVVQAVDVADWQRRCFASGAYDGARAYWREHLAGAAARPELPHDGPRRDPVGAWIAGQLEDAVVARLATRARAGESTMFVVLLAALAQLVAELTGEDDVTLGTLVAGRDRPEVRPLIGLFLNTLPLRVRLDRRAGFAAAFASARAATHGALAHAELPFERIVAEANPARQSRRNPLFDVVLNYLPPEPPATLGDLAVAALAPGPEVAAPFDVMWRVAERGARLQIRVEYRRGRFAPARIRGWLARYLDLLADVADAT